MECSIQREHDGPPALVQETPVVVKGKEARRGLQQRADLWWSRQGMVAAEASSNPILE
ncbi:hypothetical protein Bca4012_086201 [Brassica carinata]|uniref:Uncharacterized protein n=1 Tax=Brassica oleracea TaxID=3712 RepID=A0A3P6F6D3_BRAOL|nr:unnamed protein product [Brassica oleracea]